MYDPSKKQLKKKKTNIALGGSMLILPIKSLAEITYLGYDHDGWQYDETEHTATDATQIDSFMATMERICEECVGANITDMTKFSEDEVLGESFPTAWNGVAKDDGTALDLGAQCWWQYNESDKMPEVRRAGRSELCSTRSFLAVLIPLDATRSFINGVLVTRLGIPPCPHGVLALC